MGSGAGNTRDRARLRERLCIRVLKIVHLLGALGAAGCGAPSTTVTGLVTLDGRAVSGANVQFFPSNGKGQPAGVVTDDRGRYRAIVSPVPQRVVISKREVTGYLKDKNDLVDGGSPIVEERLPSPYTDLATTPLIAEPAELETTTVDFAIASSAATRN